MSAPTPAGSYPGNLSLPVEVREKILSTFRHTLDLFKDGKIDDCLIGCDFILKMDPRFAPARKLQEKAKNPNAEVDVNELWAVIAPPAPPAPPSRETGPVAPAIGIELPSSGATPWIQPTDAGATAAHDGVRRDTDPAAVSGLENLSLDSLSLDGPLRDASGAGRAGEAGIPLRSGLPAGDPGAPAFGDLSLGPTAADPGLASPLAVSAEEEIEGLLRQGDDARAGGDRQQAIEIWSRIFLLDINNADAASRIEKTRAEMAEESRRAARASAAVAPGGARLDANPAPRPAAPASAPLLPSPHDLSTVVATGDVLAEEMDQSGPPGRKSWGPRPKTGTTAEAEPEAAPAKRAAIRINRRVAMLAAAVLAVIVIGVFLATRPRAEKTTVARPGSAPSLEHATMLFGEGKIAETRQELRRIPVSDPDYAKAQKLLASLETPKGAGESAPSANAPAAAPGETTTNPAAVRAEGEKALSEKRYIDAMKAFSSIASSFPADPTFAQEIATASEKVTELTPAVKLFNDGEYETAIPILWRIYQAGRDNQDARSYLVRSYFNQGISQLQNGLYDKAKESFNEVLGLDASDADAARHAQFAEHYRGGDLDLLGRIYVRYISPRP